MIAVRRLGRLEQVCVIGLLLLGAALRLYRLQDYPAGYYNDEAAIAHAVETVMAGRHVVFFPEDTGHEPLYMYFSAPFGAVLGPTTFALRLPSAFLAMIALCAVWVATRRLFGRLTAGVALAAMSVLWWGVLLGRITLHIAPVVPMLALGLYFFSRGFGLRSVKLGANSAAALPSPHAPRSTLHFALAGCFFALAFNSYTAARVIPALTITLIAYLALVQRSILREHWRGLLTLSGVFVVLCAPLTIYLLTHPDAKQLSYSGFDVDQPLKDLLVGKPQLAVETVLQTLGMFGFTGDPLAYFNIPGRPLLDPFSAVVFIIGVAALVWRWRDRRYGFVLIGLIITLSPGMLSQPAPNYSRTVGAMAFAFIVLGIGVEVIWRQLTRWGGRVRHLGGAALLLLFLGNLVWTARDFFVVWPAMPETRWWMQTGLKEVAQALERDGSRDAAAICTSSRLIDEHVEWWRPAWWIYHYLSPRTEANVRWYDCAEAVVIPAGAAPRFAFPDVTSLDQLAPFPVARWMQHAYADQALGKSIVLRADPMPVWSAEVARLATGATVAWPQEANRDQPTMLPVDFGHALQLTAYDVEGRAAPGAVITVTTYWRVTAPLEPRLALFTHVLTGTRVVAQNDHLAITSRSLQPGDVFLQVHRVELPDIVERGWYQLSVGVYSQDTGTRLKVYDGTLPVADRIFLQPVRVGRQR